MRRLSSLLVLVPALIVLPSSPARAQNGSAPFGAGPVAVVSECRGEDRGDGSGLYSLVTTVAGGAVSLEHALTATRAVDGETSSTEVLRLLEDGKERASAGSDPGALGAWSGAAIGYVLPFGPDLSAAPRRNYRPSARVVREIVQSVVPEAKVSTRRGSDGRTSADVEVPGPQPVDALAEQFLAIRQAIREADIGLARLRIRGTATAPAGTPPPAGATNDR
jgi:hypothetical protein